jgi:hypothetical protein
VPLVEEPLLADATDALGEPDAASSPSQPPSMSPTAGKATVKTQAARAIGIDLTRRIIRVSASDGCET